MKQIIFNKIIIIYKMDELTLYLKTTEYYNIYDLEYILDKKIMITHNHIKYINRKYIFMINLFKNYGYTFTNEDYITIISKDGHILKYIPEDIITNELCETAVKQAGDSIIYVPKNKLTNEICEIAIQSLPKYSIKLYLIILL